MTGLLKMHFWNVQDFKSGIIEFLIFFEVLMMDMHLGW